MNTPLISSDVGSTNESQTNLATPPTRTAVFNDSSLEPGMAAILQAGADSICSRIKNSTRDGNEIGRALQAASNRLQDGQFVQRVEAAALCGFSIPHFRRLYRTGIVPAPIQLPARRLGFRTGDLVDRVAARQTRPVAD